MSRVTPKCCICLDYFKANNQFAAIQCGHVMHRHCLCKWFADNGYCPVCKYCPSSARSERQMMDIYLDFDVAEKNILDIIKDIGKSVFDALRLQFAKIATTIPPFVLFSRTGFTPAMLSLSNIEAKLLKELDGTWEN